MHCNMSAISLALFEVNEDGVLGSRAAALKGTKSCTVRGFSVSSSKKRGVKRASLVAPIKLGLKMCVIPWGILIQAY